MVKEIHGDKGRVWDWCFSKEDCIKVGIPKCEYFHIKKYKD